MSLELAVRSMLTTNIANGVVPDALITFGIANEGSAMPYITYEIKSVETVSIGSTDTIRMASVQVTSVGTTAEECITVYTAVEGALDTISNDTYSDKKLQTAINQNTVFESPAYGDGDEAMPYIAITSADIYYKPD